MPLPQSEGFLRPSWVVVFLYFGFGALLIFFSRRARLVDATYGLKFCAVLLPSQNHHCQPSSYFLVSTWQNTNINEMSHAIGVADYRSAQCPGNVLCFVWVQDRRNWNHLEQIPAHVLCSKEEALWSFGPQEARLWSRFLWIQAADQWYPGLQIVKSFSTAILGQEVICVFICRQKHLQMFMSGCFEKIVTIAQSLELLGRWDRCLLCSGWDGWRSSTMLTETQACTFPKGVVFETSVRHFCLKLFTKFLFLVLSWIFFSGNHENVINISAFVSFHRVVLSLKVKQRMRGNKKDTIKPDLASKRSALRI